MPRDHRILASVYDRVLASAERRGLAAQRRALLGGLRGRVLEIGAGTGLNLPHYAGVDHLTLVEPDGAMAARLRRRLAAGPPPFAVEVVTGTLEDAGLADGAADAVVSTLVLCTAGDVPALLAEVRRVLRPGGPFVILEHVRAEGGWAVTQDVLNPLWGLLAGGCNLNRHTLGALAGAGFDVAGLAAWRLPGALPFAAPAIQGVALAPG